VRRTTVGTLSDNPVSLRRKAAEFKRLAMAAGDPEVIEELEALTQRYLERAKEIEAGPSPQSIDAPDRAPI